MADNQNQNTNQQPTTQPADNGNQSGGKMFTQEEVNQIVSERLRREREKSTQQPKDDREAALQEREKAVAAKENAHLCRDYLAEVNISEKFHNDLMEALGTSDVDKFKSAVDKISKYFIPVTTTTGVDVAHPPQNHVTQTADERIAAAFKPNT